MYAKEILHYNMTTFVPCLLLVKAPHYHHLNLKTISPKRSNWTHFLNLGMEMMDHYHGLFPTWNTFETTRHNATLPNHEESTVRHVKRYSKTCPYYHLTTYNQTHVKKASSSSSSNSNAAGSSGEKIRHGTDGSKKEHIGKQKPH
jgi:hypothetical protein